MKRLLLIDGTNFFFRGSWGGNLTFNGRNVKNLYSFVGNLCSLVRKFEDAGEDVDVVVCWDGGYDERLKISEEAVSSGLILKSYKQERREARENNAEDVDFTWQLKKAQEMLAYTRIRQCRIQGEEADDVVGSYCRANLGRFDEIDLVTTDRDYYQLLWEGVRIYNSTKDEYISMSDITMEYGITTPEQWIDVGAIAGESGSSSDTIYGVPGIGYKGASMLISRYGSIGGIMDSAETIYSQQLAEYGYEGFRQKVIDRSFKPKHLKEAMVLAYRDVLEIAYQLKRIHTHLDVSLYDTSPSWELLEEFFQSLRFKVSTNNFHTLLRKPCTPVQFHLEVQE